jgi:hypothetical protein
MIGSVHKPCPVCNRGIDADPYDGDIHVCMPCPHCGAPIALHSEEKPVEGGEHEWRYWFEPAGEDV